MFDQFTQNALIGNHDAAMNAAEQAAQKILQTSNEATHTECFREQCDGVMIGGVFTCHCLPKPGTGNFSPLKF